MAALSSQEVARRLQSLPDWALQAGAIRRTYAFDGFRQAVAFVDRVAEAAEAADHHPDIDIRYDRVTLVLVTHDEGGLTGRDFALAARADELARA